MNEQLLPSRRRLLLGTGVALIAASVILVTVVLPAEYGVDPIGTGRALGLTAMSGSRAAPAPEVMHEHPRKFYSGQVEIAMKGREELEYKATLAQGEPLLYTWRVQGGPVYFEFHGEPTQGEWPEDFFQSYQIKESSEGEQGSFVAPFTGQHGWYWRNLSDQPATITLEAVGYYSRLARIENSPAQTE